ncbi:MAG TPA: DegV family protein [Anaerolineae bacterium]|nr:DegV family protein [Anaerolineae bacterium]
MRKVVIVTDTATDIPQELAEELGIVLAPLHVIIEGRDYRDKIDISGVEFYRLLPKLNPLPTTSGVGVSDFLEAYEKALKMADSVVCLAIAEPLSTTFNSACVAREMMADADIAVVDTQTAAAGEALIAIAAGKAAKEGADKAQVLALVEELIPRVDTLITADTLEYLHRGGRLTAPQALIGKFLGFRPILRLRESKIVPVGRARSRRRSIEHLLQLMEEEVGTEREICAAVMHALASEEAEALRDEIVQRFNCREIHILDDLGPVAGTHLGPGALGVGFYALP